MKKIAAMDSVDVRFADQWLSNLESALQGKAPDYLVIQHMEPDHSGSIQQFIQTYPQTKLVGNTKTFTMLKNYFGSDYSENQLMVKNWRYLTTRQPYSYVRICPNGSLA